MTLVSYDTSAIVLQKTKWIKQSGLGGAAWWDTSGDRPCDDPDSLISVGTKELGGEGLKDLEKVRNWLEFPDSTYENLRDQMGTLVLDGACPQ